MFEKKPASVKVTDFMQKVTSQMPDSVVYPLSALPPIKRIPTGSFDLDLATGGGIPTGRFTIIWGDESAGKTSLVTQISAQAQKLCRYDALPLGDPTIPGNSTLPLNPTLIDPEGVAHGFEDDVEIMVPEDPEKPKSRKKIPKTVKAHEAAFSTSITSDLDENGEPIVTQVLNKGWSLGNYQEPMRVLFVNVENTFDDKWAISIGVDPDNFFFLPSSNVEEIADVVNMAIRDDFADLIIIDSVASMITTFEDDKSSAQETRGLMARRFGLALKKWLTSLIRREYDSVDPAIILVNQVRYDLNKKYGDPSTLTGGKSQKFAASLQIRVRKGSESPDKKDRAPDSEGGYLQLARTDFVIEKNKTFPPKASGQFITAVVPYDGHGRGQIVQFKQIIKTAQQYGVLTKDKGKWVLGEESYSTLEEIKQWSQDNPTDFELFKRALVEAIVKERAGG